MGPSPSTHRDQRSRRPLLGAALVLALICAFAAATVAPAETLREKLDSTRGKLDRVQERQDDVADTIAAQNAEIDSMLGEVSVLRREQLALEAKLEAKQAELDRATADLEAAQRHLQRVRDRLRRALAVLRERLVSIYEAGSADMVAVVLESDNWGDVTTRADYLSRIQDYDDAVASRVRDLRDEAKAAVRRMTEVRERIEAARDEIAAAEKRAAAARAEAEVRFGELKAAQAERRRTLDALESRATALSNNLASISEQIAGAGGTVPQSAPAPLTPGQTANYISPNQASVPSGAPPAIKAAIEAANAIASTPYIWGGGHGSFSSPGYDCSGAVSYALNGGGFLSSPLDSTGLSTWGEPGPGQWISVYANSGHAWMIIAGLAFDTSGSGGSGPRWHSSPPNSPAGFIVRHPPGY